MFEKLVVIAFFVIAIVLVFAQKGVYSSTNKKAVCLYEKGMRCYYSNDISGAENKFKKSVKVDPQFAEPNIMLGELYDERNIDSIACIYYYAAMNANPSYYTIVWYKIGELEFNQKHYTEAMEAYRKFLALDKNNKDLHDKVEKKLKSITSQRIDESDK